MVHVAGVDSIVGGWAVVISDRDLLSISKVGRLTDLIEREPCPEIIAIDVPIGLPEQYQRGGRACDRTAREILGRGHASSVFSPPIRTALAATSWADACERSRNSGLNGRPVSKQTYAIFPKIKEVDDLLQSRPRLRDIVREIHPEVSFFELFGQKMRHAKSKLIGREERRSALQSYFADFPALEEAGRKVRIPFENILDATVACWSGLRLANGEGHSLPQVPPEDGLGLPMAIWV